MYIPNKCTTCNKYTNNEKTYTCDSCYEQALLECEKEFFITTTKDSRRFNIMREFAEYYGVDKESVIDVKLKPKRIEFSEEVHENNNRIFGLYNVQSKRHICVFKGGILFALAVNFGTKHIIEKKTDILVEYEIV